MAVVVCLGAPTASAQWLAAGDELNEELRKETNGQLSVSLELRNRFERRDGQAFGAEPDRVYDLYRTRVGLKWDPTPWLRVAGTLQDARAPGFSANAPTNVRDGADLHEAYVEIRGSAKNGFGLAAGRKMLNYGDGRLIGVPDWGNTARTFDHGRLWWNAGTAHLEVLMVSAPKVRLGEFNRPGLGERVWGTYDTLPKLKGGHQGEAYILRHEQNAPGGFTGPGTLGVTAFGTRWVGPVAAGWKYDIEAVLQRGHVGPAKQRAGALSAVLQRSFGPVTASGEYKYASGSGDPSDTAHTGTFDQMYAANHDKFGHQDLFGWRNMQDVRLVASWKVRPKVTLNAMYDSYWLARRRDALYGLAGKAIARSADGSAGRHIGQDIDFFAVWKPVKPLSFGAGVGFFATGEFVDKMTPGVAPLYLYFYQMYSF